MGKNVDFSKSVHDLCKEDPQIIEIMKGLGFEQITSPVSLNTAGRFMTIPKGAIMKGIDLEKIKDEFSRNGYTIIE